MDFSEKIIIKRISNEALDIEDEVVKEYPLTIFIDGEEFITLLCSPDSLEYLAAGFLISEGIINYYSEIESINVNERDGFANVILKGGANFKKGLFGRRVLTTGCGKGSIFYSAAQRLNSVKVESNVKITYSQVLNLVKLVEAKGEIFKRTGGVHGCGICNLEEVLIFHEDIGRHNALDKVFGEASAKNIELNDKIVVTSGRITSEILLKCLKREIPIIISRSAPTDLAIRLARESGITVIGFVRGSRINVYSGEERIIESN